MKILKLAHRANLRIFLILLLSKAGQAFGCLFLTSATAPTLVAFAISSFPHDMTLQISQWQLIFNAWHYPWWSWAPRKSVDFPNLTQSIGFWFSWHYSQATTFLKKLPLGCFFARSIMPRLSKLAPLRRAIMSRYENFPSLRKPYNVIGIRIAFFASIF